ncbi:hypothetical protein PCANC_25503 [Puccinia coronata f. sp. avenae]|uniref:Major facilitator superfamily (MFS) profile domain-containing protein n=1 Tax=Puccinia coronata f. sp. avenae TaxID=200324 RepID=A0A2N5U9B0_9BASI|nr:hypothetical protein PCANC_25503 [Puccinia coronata f. sp. avenae]
MSPRETTPLLAAPISTPAWTTSPPHPEEDAVHIEVEHPLGSSPAALLPPLPVFLGALNSIIVATLMSSILSNFGASNQISWLASVYLLSASATGALYGKIADILGRQM